MKTKLLAIILTVSSMSFNNLAHSQELNLNRVINKVVQAYGGETLTRAQGIKLTDHNKGPWPGESEHPGVPELWRINEVLTIDFKNKRKSLLSWRVNRTSVDLDKFIFDGKQGKHFDVLHNKYSNQDWIKYDSLGGSMIRTSDTMLAYMLSHSIDTAKSEGITPYRGKPHNKLSFMNNGMKFLLYVDLESGLIRKMVRENPRVGSLVYVFSNHKQSDGVTYADDMNFFVGGELRIMSIKRDIEINPSVEHEFKLVKGFKSWGERIDTSKMQTKEITDGVFQSGKGRELTIFIDNGDHFIASGDGRAFESNYKAMKAHSGSNKPVNYFVVTHHHRNTLAGLDTVLANGVKLVLTESHLESVEEHLGQKLTSEQAMLIHGRQTKDLGRAKLIDLATSHSKHNLIVYLPEEKVLYAEEHYESDLKTAYPRVFKDMVLFYQQIQKLNLDVIKYVDAHSFRQFSNEEFATFANDFKTHTCPTEYDVCM